MEAQGGHREVRQFVTGADANLVTRVAGRVQEAGGHGLAVNVMVGCALWKGLLGEATTRGPEFQRGGERLQSVRRPQCPKPPKRTNMFPHLNGVFCMSGRTGRAQARGENDNHRGQGFSFVWLGGWRCRLQKLEDEVSSRTTVVERVYTEKKIDTQKVYVGAGPRRS